MKILWKIGNPRKIQDLPSPQRLCKAAQCVHKGGSPLCARPKAAPPLLGWRAKAATFVVVVNRVNIVAVSTIIVDVGLIGYHVPRQSCFMFPRSSCNARLHATGLQGSRGDLGAQGLLMFSTIMRTNFGSFVNFN